MKEIVLASNNKGKIKEFQAVFSQLGIKVIPQQDFNVPEVDEPFGTFVENALHKARHCSKYTGLPALADDSGLCVSSLNGAPGIYSARYAGEAKSDQQNNQKLISELSKIEDKSAYYYCILILVRHKDDPQPIIADGNLNGQIILQPKGTNGFGYDPHFYLPQYNKTAAELEPELKNRVSHRGMAIKQLIDKLNCHCPT